MTSVSNDDDGIDINEVQMEEIRKSAQVDEEIRREHTREKRSD